MIPSITEDSALFPVRILTGPRPFHYEIVLLVEFVLLESIGSVVDSGVSLPLMRVYCALV